MNIVKNVISTVRENTPTGVFTTLFPGSYLFRCIFSFTFARFLTKSPFVIQRYRHSEFLLRNGAVVRSDERAFSDGTLIIVGRYRNDFASPSRYLVALACFSNSTGVVVFSKSCPSSIFGSRRDRLLSDRRSGCSLSFVATYRDSRDRNLPRR